MPSVVAWGVRAVVPDDSGEQATTSAARPTPSPTPEAEPESTPSSPSSPSAIPSSTWPTAQVEGPATPAQEAQRLPTSVAAEPPTALRFPSGTVVRVRPTRTLPDGNLGVPDNLRTAGWWRGGARIGDLYGSMLVAAHVDSADRGLGPFVALLTVPKGARFTVASRNLQQDFQVTARRIIPRERLPRARWVSTFRGPHRLTMVTCAPPYNRARGGYQNLAIVVAKPVGPPRPR